MIELMVSCFIFGLLTVVLFFFYRMGASAWKKGDAESELLQNLQVACRKISRPLEASSATSVSTYANATHTALSFLTAVGAADTFMVQPDTLLPDWQSYQVFYFERAQQTLYQREVDLLAGSSQHTVPGPIQSFVSSSGTHPLGFYCTDGRPIARHLTDLTVTLNGSLVTIEAEAQMKRYGSERNEQLRLRSTTHLRN